MNFWKSLINLKELQKSSGKSLRVWAKNQLRFEIFDKILKFIYKNLKRKRIFFTDFSPIFQNCHFIHMWNMPKHFGLVWGDVPPGLGGSFALGEVEWVLGFGCINPCMGGQLSQVLLYFYVEFTFNKAVPGLSWQWRPSSRAGIDCVIKAMQMIITIHSWPVGMFFGDSVDSKCWLVGGVTALEYRVDNVPSQDMFSQDFTQIDGKL